MRFKLTTLVFSGIVFIILGCSSLTKGPGKEFGIEQFNRLMLGVDSKESIKKTVGSPSEVATDTWVYHVEGVPKLWLFFENDLLVSVSWSVWESDKVNEVRNLLEKFEGNWAVIKEPMANPHRAPSMCYLEDLSNGRRVEVDGHKKTVDELFKWQPNANAPSIKQRLLKQVGKEFCIAGLCSKVTNPEAWKHNHCEWLEQLVAEIKKKSIESK